MLQHHGRGVWAVGKTTGGATSMRVVNERSHFCHGTHETVLVQKSCGEEVRQAAREGGREGSDLIWIQERKERRVQELRVVPIAISDN
jgi:hypothetical protein